METPSSSTRTNFIFSRKIEESGEFGKMKSDRSALFDITNDSPIVGLAMGSLKTPSSAMSKKKRVIGRGQSAATPGSGEALLRGQVKTLLQKVEEEAELSKVENRPFLNLLNKSTINFVAPTPANTPQLILNDGGTSSCLPYLTPSDHKVLIPQMMLSEKEKGEGSIDSEDLITRSLLLEFSEKSLDSSSPGLTYHDEDEADDAASVWSIQANASSTRDEEDEGYFSDFKDVDENERGDKNDKVVLDDLCEGISKISVTEFAAGKHIRFVYDSDDEVVSVSDSCSPTSTS